MYAHSEERPAPNNQEGAVTDQEQDRLSAGPAGEDWEATPFWRRWDLTEGEDVSAWEAWIYTCGDERRSDTENINAEDYTTGKK